MQLIGAAYWSRELKIPEIESSLITPIFFTSNSALQVSYQVAMTFICLYKNVKFQSRRISQSRSGLTWSRNIRDLPYALPEDRVLREKTKIASSMSMNSAEDQRLNGYILSFSSFL